MSASDSSTSRSLRALAITLGLGLTSAGLYFLLFVFSDLLPELASATRRGEKLFALIPIVIALVFSFVHGAFTGRFWDVVGLRAKK